MQTTPLLVQPPSDPVAQTEYLNWIDLLDRQLESQYQSKIILEPELNRQLVSFQANKSKPVYRWYKYKEGFSASLIEYLLTRFNVTQGRVLDPFAGSGTTLFVASEQGIDADGIELLPIGQQIIRTRKIIDAGLSTDDILELRRWATDHPWHQVAVSTTLPELRITAGAYPKQTQSMIAAYRTALQDMPANLQIVLQFALLCVLEVVSYTRKDGQYLRWDYRSRRRQGVKPFDKGPIIPFDQAISDKLVEILCDLSGQPLQGTLFENGHGPRGAVRLIDGSCLDLVPTLPSNCYDAIITSPPYCNRYDYTRTYALELALLDVGEAGLSNLRQNMLSCTVENRAKDLLRINPGWSKAIQAADQQELLQAVLTYLDMQRTANALNNSGIPRMVRGYFYEMACVIAESARVLKSGAPLIMVNDNVRYAGASISVDLILSNLAERFGLRTERILVLPNGKGNSSQQMGEHGRAPLRKCVYVWRKK
jgi:DNA modification methylase